ncbi:MAG: mediator of RNA polymerase II transcription subunit 9 [Turicibacter sp.]|nr:mediator of RNA polymerase II transcription subunit 9 [Turicibacter sp.]
MTSLTVYLDEKMHNEFEEVCQNAGLNATATILTFVNEVVQTREVPKTAAYTTPIPRPMPREKTMRERMREPQDPNVDVMEECRKAVQSMREQAALDGISEMTMEEIDAEIALARKENREKEALLAELRRKAAPFEDQSNLLPVTRLWSEELDMEIEERLNGWEVTVHRAD